MSAAAVGASTSLKQSLNMEAKIVFEKATRNCLGMQNDRMTKFAWFFIVVTVALATCQNASADLIVVDWADNLAWGPGTRQSASWSSTPDSLYTETSIVYDVGYFEAIAHSQVEFHVTSDATYNMSLAGGGAFLDLIDRSLGYDIDVLRNYGSSTGLLLVGHEYRLYDRIDFGGHFDTPGSLSGSGVLTASAVPEPSTLALLGLGILGAIINSVRRRRYAV